MTASNSDENAMETASWTRVDSNINENFTIIYAHFKSRETQPVPQTSNAKMHVIG